MSASVIILIVTSLILANFYVGLNYNKLIKEENSKLLIIVFWVFQCFFTFVLILNFLLFFTGRHNGRASIVIEYIAGFTASFSLYSIIMFIIRDIFRQLAKVIPFHNASRLLGNFVYRCGMIAVITASIITVYGFVNAKNYKVIDYNVTLDKKESTIDGLNAVFVSDAHMGCAVGAAELQIIVDKINAVNPDVIFLGGDFFDDGTTEQLKEDASEILKGLTAKYGVYFVLGNHECYLDDDAKQESYFTNAGIQVIDDKVVTIDNKFILVGRKDRTNGRVDITKLMQGVETEKLPVILLDHEPIYKDMKKVAAEGADLQLSGHTHAGQIFPTYLFDFFETVPWYGEYKTGDMQTLVSSGVGDWAVPIRIGSPSEIMYVHISFEGF